jgi:predicted PurR-regulated permease PerM
MTRDDSFSSRVFTLVSLGLLSIGLIAILKPFAVPLLWAGLLAVLLFPANVTLCHGLGQRRTLAALLLTTAVVLIIVIPSVMVIGAFVGQATELVRWLQTSATEHHIAGPQDVLALPAVDRVVRWLGANSPVSAEELKAAAVSAGQRGLETLIGTAGSIFASALGAATSVILSLFMFFFFVRDGEEIVARTMGLVPIEPQRKTQLVAHLAAVTKGVVLGSLATAVVQGILTGIAFAIAGLPSPIVFGALAMVASLIPFVGSALVWVPAALVLALQGSWGWGLFMAGWGAGVVSSADNFVRPLFVSSRAKISTLPVFIGLFGGISAFGPIGMFLGPVLVALALALVRFAEESRVVPTEVIPEGPQVSATTPRPTTPVA